MIDAAAILEHVKVGGGLFSLGAVLGWFAGFEMGKTRPRRKCADVIKRLP